MCPSVHHQRKFVCSTTNLDTPTSSTSEPHEWILVGLTSSVQLFLQLGDFGVLGCEWGVLVCEWGLLCGEEVAEPDGVDEGVGRGCVAVVVWVSVGSIPLLGVWEDREGIEVDGGEWEEGMMRGKRKGVGNENLLLNNALKRHEILNLTTQRTNDDILNRNMPVLGKREGDTGECVCC